jgi:hypothetical protein
MKKQAIYTASDRDTGRGYRRFSNDDAIYHNIFFLLQTNLILDSTSRASESKTFSAQAK